MRESSLRIPDPSRDHLFFPLPNLLRATPKKWMGLLLSLYFYSFSSSPPCLFGKGSTLLNPIISSSSFVIISPYSGFIISNQFTLRVGPHVSVLLGSHQHLLVSLWWNLFTPSSNFMYQKFRSFSSNTSCNLLLQIFYPLTLYHLIAFNRFQPITLM